MVLLVLLSYMTLSFAIQSVWLSGLLSRRQLRHFLSLPRVLVPSDLCLQQPGPAELLLEVRLPNILWGIQVFWELRLRDEQTGRKICLRYQLRSGPNRIQFPLHEAEPRLLAQFQRGLYRRGTQCFYVRDCLAILHLRYCLKQALELAVLLPAGPPDSRQDRPANTRQDPLSTAVHKFAQEGQGEQRPYYPGDDPRRINWKLYSRFQELYVRIPEEQPVFSQDLHCYFVPDMACYPKFLRTSVLDWASTYFLRCLRDLQRGGYRISAFIPNEERSEDISGILYQESSEELILRLLADYPRNASWENSVPDGRTNKRGLERLLRTARASNLVFTSPHSIENLSHYFPQAQYIPLPEPAAPLRKDLLQQSPVALVPASLLWHWLLQGKEHLRDDSRSLYRKLGLLLGQSQTTPQKAVYQPTQRYPQLLRYLWAWKRYYQQPQRRYSVGRARRSH